MRAFNVNWTAGDGWVADEDAVDHPELILFFGDRGALDSGLRYSELKTLYRNSLVVGCSTGGQIFGDEVTDDVITGLGIKFDRTTISLATDSDEMTSSFSRGQSLGRQLSRPDLQHVFILADGTNINGSELVRGLTDTIGLGPSITGGLAGDGPRFARTLICANAAPSASCVAAMGFYGKSLVVGHSSMGGWDEFGPKRMVTRSRRNVVFELDGEPILDFYKRYLGPEANDLPGAGLLYPLSIFDPASPRERVVRTILGMSEAEKTLTFAGDVPEGFCAQLMQGRFDRLAEAAGDATSHAFSRHDASSFDVAAIYVSCVGRRILMGQNIIDEIIATRSAAWPGAKSVGFYSYGEICPIDSSGVCGLHNQSMTVTTLAEVY